VFKLDGAIEVRVQLHGTTLNRGTSAEREASAPKIGKDARGTLVSAPHHQHFLSFRLDLDIDGPSNQLMEMEARPLAAAGYKNAFESATQDLPREGFRDVEPQAARHWHIENARLKNAFGKPTGYALEPEALAFPYAAPDFIGLQRASFAQHALWFTRYRDDERYASGEFPNQAAPGPGLAAYANDEALRGQDIVLWYTLGFTHLARPEDYPVMPGETIGFKLQPRGFFRQNPALELGE
jgi:primary-amine oxidase